VNNATKGINDLIKVSQTQAEAKAQQSKKKKINWRSDPTLFRAPANPRFIPGSVNFSPAWFALGHEVSIVYNAILSTVTMRFVSEAFRSDYRLYHDS
jgi:hypothetical protein